VRKLANSLIFEVADSIREVSGATAARKLILERAQECLDDLATESGTYTCSDTGFILDRRGDSDAAISYCRKALDICAAMVAADPHDTRARLGLASTYSNIGLNLERKTDLSGALDSYKKTLTRLVAKESPGQTA
jgi:tetratricopeptide (TPR) repeat protein